MKRLLIAAAASGAGKTSWTLGLLRLISRRGVAVQAFKSGPDYIDPALHSLLTSCPSRTLDLRLMGRSSVVRCFRRHAAAAELSVIEGVMGYYDGAAEGSSSADLARLLAAPAVLILDAAASQESAAAVALGFLRYRRRSMIRGFLLNRVGSDRHLASLKRAVENATGLPVLGSLPKDASIGLPERHLGLHAGTENPGFFAAADRIADLLEDRLDLDALTALASGAPELPGSGAAADCDPAGEVQARRRREPAGRAPVLGVARDEAFRFYYEDNLDRLRDLGAELRFFSPLHDGALPMDCAGLYLGGGYPELYGKELSENTGMREAIRAAADSGMPIFAECGGYMYLQRELVGAEGDRFPMAAVFEGSARMGRRLSALGYHRGRVVTPSPFAPEGTILRGHCFHWSSVEPPPPAREAALELSKNGAEARLDGGVRNAVFASYLHLHFASCPAFAARFVRACRSYHRTRSRTHG